jgi:hypothetical protein
VEPTTEKHDVRFVKNITNDEGKSNTDDGNPVICQRISILSSDSSQSSYSYAFTDSTIGIQETVVNVDATLSENISKGIDLFSDLDSLSSISDETND